MCLPLNGEIVNRYKLVNCFLKKEGIDFSESDKYYNMSNLEELIQSKYDLKIIDWKHLQNAKKVGHELSEYEEQKKVVHWCRENKIPVQSSGNGFALDTGNNVNYIAKLKASGMSLGYPDLDVFIGNGISLHIEMKREKGGVVSDTQQRWINWFNNNGYKAKVCKGAEEAINWIIQEREKNA